MNFIKIILPLIFLNSCEFASSRKTIGENGAIQMTNGISFYAEQYEKAANLIAENQYLEAEKIYKKLTKLEPNSENSWIGLASANAFLGNYDLAIKYNNIALTKSPNSVLALIGLGSAFYRKEEHFQAIRYYRKANSLDESLPDPYWGLAFCYDKLQNLDSAKYYGRIYLKKDPETKFKIYFDEILKK